MISDLDTTAPAKPTAAQKRRGVKPEQETALAQPAGPVIELVFSPRRLEAILVSGTITPAMLIELFKLIPGGVNQLSVANAWRVGVVWRQRDYIPPQTKPATRRIAFLS